MSTSHHEQARQYWRQLQECDVATEGAEYMRLYGAWQEANRAAIEQDRARYVKQLEARLMAARSEVMQLEAQLASANLTPSDFEAYRSQQYLSC